MPKLPYALLDIFAAAPMQGNALAVVLEADELGDEVMAAFARETRLSETSFIQAADVPGADYRNRIFMVIGEVPFAGHPSLGGAVAVSMAAGESSATYTQQTVAGLQSIEVSIEGSSAQAWMGQDPAVFSDEIDPARVLAPLGLTAADAVRGRPPQVVSTGLANLIVPVAEAALAKVRPDLDALGRLLDEIGATVAYLAAFDGRTGRVRARGFSHAVIGGEDPATGSAAGPLLAYLAPREGCRAIEISQGVEMGRPSLIFAELDGDTVRVGGPVKRLIEGTVELPA